MSPFLDADGLYQLTGYVMPSKQIEWLRKNAVPHFVNAQGRPVVQANPLDKKPVQEHALGPVR